MTLHLDYGEDRYLESHWHVMGMSWACRGTSPNSSQFQSVPASSTCWWPKGANPKAMKAPADTGHFPRLTLAYEDVNVSTKRTQRNGKERK